MNVVGVLLGLHPKLGLILSVDESRETQNASGIGGRRIASEFACHGTQQGLAVFPVNTRPATRSGICQAMYLRCNSAAAPGWIAESSPRPTGHRDRCPGKDDGWSECPP